MSDPYLPTMHRVTVTFDLVAPQPNAGVPSLTYIGDLIRGTVGSALGKNAAMGRVVVTAIEIPLAVKGERHV